MTSTVVSLLGVLSILLTLAVLARLHRHVRLQRHWPVGRHPLPAGTPPFVSILVPARNEERNLEACLDSLLAQDHPAFEVLVWDDASQDATRAIAERFAARDPRLRVLAGDGPPPGWIGKCWALDRLAAEARGEWLLFADADTFHAPDSLSTGLASARHHRVEALSVSGEGILGSFWERAWEPLWPCFLFWWLPPDRINDPASPIAFAIGQWFLISRAAYEASGGHAAVRGEIVEDCALAARLKRSGVPYRVVLGTRLFRVRMYRSLAEIWEGWSKNAEPALRLFGGGPLAAPASAATLAMIGVFPFVTAAAAAAGLLPGVGAIAAYGPALFALGVSLLVRRLRGSNPRDFWTLPLAAGVAALILLNSAARARLGLPVAWKGRSYPGGAPR